MSYFNFVFEYKGNNYSLYSLETLCGSEYSCPLCCGIAYEKVSNSFICSKCSCLFDIGCLFKEESCAEASYYPIVYLHSEKILINKNLDNIDELKQESEKLCICTIYNCDHPESYKNGFPKDKYPSYYSCECKTIRNKENAY